MDSAMCLSLAGDQEIAIEANRVGRVVVDTSPVVERSSSALIHGPRDLRIGDNGDVVAFHLASPQARCADIIADAIFVSGSVRVQSKTGRSLISVVDQGVVSEGPFADVDCHEAPPHPTPVSPELRTPDVVTMAAPQPPAEADNAPTGPEPTPDSLR